ncbi:MAG: M28 family peptidase [Bryobacteraceae bacterium]
MFGLKLGMGAMALVCVAALPAAEFSGTRALEYARAVTAMGPRPSGSAANKKAQAYIKAQLQGLGCQVTEDAFTGTPPSGPIPMTNLIAKFPGKSGMSVVFTGHFDTKVFKEFKFVGANDAGSSSGVLLEMAKTLAGQVRKHDVYLLWFDGEEAVGEWSDRDGIHGSRHLAQKWSQEGKLGKILALINVDMIGDKDLGIALESNSNQGLRRLVWQVAKDLGYGSHFLEQPGAIEDDHMPFVRQGVTALDLIDFDYGPGNSYWHTEKDTVDKLSGQSLKVVGDVLVETLKRLEK